MRRRLPVGAMLLAIAAAAFAHGITVAPLGPAQIPELLNPPAHGERIIMLWALDCAYCAPNMQALAKLQRTHPKRIQLVTVATDNIALRGKLAEHLAAAGMQGYPAHAYTESSPARINFLIDPQWGGELPRTIVIRADGSHVALSGELTAAQIKLIAPE